VIISRKMRGEGHVARMGERRSAYRILVGENAGVDERIILKSMLRKWDGVA
jgi:hypothetical protein